MHDGPSLPGAGFQTGNLRYHHFYLTALAFLSGLDLKIGDLFFIYNFISKLVVFVTYRHKWLTGNCR